ncbi:2-iminobutanoate/2-iminopropanoate deaminase [Aquimarina intermedia]|uniref:2-iminobutanoate/2-iminopropanoate deaminase n=2 Tax=Aquimarina intermedia TaxID=350814 RepID=A0A5S5BX24_9FLAO|nr:2-iminobutanoate/2-iminopropanoate deaminase [Aquimarina intermedia]
MSKVSLLLHYTHINILFMKKIITTTNAPAPIGPYNQAILSGNTLYTSGQIAIDPKTNQLVLEDITKETEQVMKNVKAILDEAGYTFEDVIKTTIFLSDMNNFAKVNEVYGQYFDEATAPARETVAVKALPKFVNVEISVIAVR